MIFAEEIPCSPSPLPETSSQTAFFSPWSLAKVKKVPQISQEEKQEENWTKNRRRLIQMLFSQQTQIADVEFAEVVVGVAAIEESVEEEGVVVAVWVLQVIQGKMT